MTYPPPIPEMLALDPSLRCTGAVVVTLDGMADLVDGYAIETCPGVTRADSDSLERMHDGGDRGLVLFDGLGEIFTAHPHIVHVAFESPTGAKDSNAAWSLARANQATRCAIHAHRPDLAPRSTSSYDAKLAATGHKVPKRAKHDVKVGVRARWGPSAWGLVLAPYTTRAQHEAMYDAGAVAMAALRTRAARLIIRDYKRGAR